LCHLHEIQTSTLQAIQTTQTTPNLWMTLEHNLHGFHQNALLLIWLWHNPGHCQSTLQADHILSNSRHYHFTWVSKTVCNPYLLQAQYSIPCHFQLWIWVCLKLFPVLRSHPWHETPLYFWISPWGRQLDRIQQPDVRTVPLCLLQQDNWSDLFPLAEFVYNNTLSATTSVSPFFANKGYHLNIRVHPERDITSSHTSKFAMKLRNYLQKQKRNSINIWITWITNVAPGILYVILTIFLVSVY